MAPRKRKQYEESTVIVFHDEDPLNDIETTTLVDTMSTNGRRTMRREHTVYTPAAPPPRETTRVCYDNLDNVHPGFSYPAGDEDDTTYIQPPRKGKAQNLYFLSTVTHLVQSAWNR